MNDDRERLEMEEIFEAIKACPHLRLGRYDTSKYTVNEMWEKVNAWLCGALPERGGRREDECELGVFPWQESSCVLRNRVCMFIGSVEACEAWIAGYRLALSGGREAEADMVTKLRDAAKDLPDINAPIAGGLLPDGVIVKVRGTSEKASALTGTVMDAELRRKVPDQSCNLAGCNGTCGICTPAPEDSIEEELEALGRGDQHGCWKGGVFYPEPDDVKAAREKMDRAADAITEKMDTLAKELHHEEHAPCRAENAALQSLIEWERWKSDAINKVLSEEIAALQSLAQKQREIVENSITTKQTSHTVEALELLRDDILAAFDALSTEGET